MIEPTMSKWWTGYLLILAWLCPPTYPLAFDPDISHPRGGSTQSLVDVCSTNVAVDGDVPVLTTSKCIYGIAQPLTPGSEELFQFQGQADRINATAYTCCYKATDNPDYNPDYHTLTDVTIYLSYDGTVENAVPFGRWNFVNVDRFAGHSPRGGFVGTSTVIEFSGESGITNIEQMIDTANPEIRCSIGHFDTESETWNSVQEDLPVELLDTGNVQCTLIPWNFNNIPTGEYNFKVTVRDIPIYVMEDSATPASYYVYDIDPDQSACSYNFTANTCVQSTGSEVGTTIWVEIHAPQMLPPMRGEEDPIIAPSLDGTGQCQWLDVSGNKSFTTILDVSNSKSPDHVVCYTNDLMEEGVYRLRLSRNSLYTDFIEIPNFNVTVFEPTVITEVTPNQRVALASSALITANEDLLGPWWEGDVQTVEVTLTTPKGQYPPVMAVAPLCRWVMFADFSVDGNPVPYLDTPSFGDKVSDDGALVVTCPVPEFPFAFYGVLDVLVSLNHQTFANTLSDRGTSYPSPPPDRHTWVCGGFGNTPGLGDDSNLFCSGTCQCEYCTRGAYAASGMLACTQCVQGRFQSANGRSSCEDCPSGLYSAAGASVCDTCQPGLYTVTPNSPVCTLCTAGRYTDSMGSSACKRCERGKYRGDGDDASEPCIQCPPGYYQDLPAQAGCKACQPPEFQNKLGQSECITCPEGSFVDNEGSVACQQCPLNTFWLSPRSGLDKVCIPCPEGSETKGTNTTGLDSCVCKIGTFGSWSQLRRNYPEYDKTDDELAEMMAFGEQLPLCQSCYKESAQLDILAGQTCSEVYALLGNIQAGKLLPSEVAGWCCDEVGQTAPKARRGYWMDAEDNRWTELCSPLAACPGANELNTICADGYDDSAIACSVCAPNWYRFNGVCEPCPDRDFHPGIFFIIFIVFLVIYLGYKVRGKVTLRTAKQGDVMGLMKSFVNFMQVLSILGTFNVQWQFDLSWLFRIANYFRGFSVELMRPECTISITFYQKYLFTVALPFMISLLFSIIGVLLLCHSVLIVKYGSKFAAAHPKWTKPPEGFGSRIRYSIFAIFHRGFNPESLRLAVDSFRQVYLQFLLIIYIQLARTALEYFSCQPVEATGGQTFVLIAEKSTLCYAGDWLNYLSLAIFITVTCVFGIPLYVLVALWRNRFNLDDERTIRKYSFLYDRYEPKFMWWEVVILLRKIGIVAVDVFMPLYPIEQPMMGLVVIFSSLLLQVFARPYIRTNNDRMETTFLFALVYILCVAWLSNLVDWGSARSRYGSLKQSFMISVYAVLVLTAAVFVMTVSLELVAAWKAKIAERSGEQEDDMKNRLKKEYLKERKERKHTEGLRYKKEENLRKKRQTQRLELMKRQSGVDSDVYQLAAKQRTESTYIYTRQLLTRNELMRIEEEGQQAKAASAQLDANIAELKHVLVGHTNQLQALRRKSDKLNVDLTFAAQDNDSLTTYLGEIVFDSRKEKKRRRRKGKESEEMGGDDAVNSGDPQADTGMEEGREEGEYGYDYEYEGEYVDQDGNPVERPHAWGNASEESKRDFDIDKFLEANPSYCDHRLDPDPVVHKMEETEFFKMCFRVKCAEIKQVLAKDKQLGRHISAMRLEQVMIEEGVPMASWEMFIRAHLSQ